MAIARCLEVFDTDSIRRVGTHVLDGSTSDMSTVRDGAGDPYSTHPLLKKNPEGLDALHVFL